LSWFNLDETDPEESRDFLIRTKEMKGRLVKVYDDETGQELTDEEVKELEEFSDMHPFFLPMFDPDNEKIKEVKIRKPRKYKSRIPIPPQLRKAILEFNNSQCSECGRSDANQLHHKDENPSNNAEENLQLLCYQCHQRKHRKRIIEIRK